MDAVNAVATATVPAAADDDAALAAPGPAADAEGAAAASAQTPGATNGGGDVDGDVDEPERTVSYTEAVTSGRDTPPSPRRSSFMPRPEERLVTVLTAAELHQLRKDSAAVKARNEMLSKVICEAKINQEFVFPNGEKRRVRASDVIDAGREQVRLLQVQEEPMGIAFENLTIAVHESESKSIQTTGTKLLSAARAAKRLACGGGGPVRRTVVEGVSGSVRPGEMLLVIGAAGSGCSSLLKVLAGRYDATEVTVTGELSYAHRNCSQDGRVWLPPEHVASRIGFCYEGDDHVPELTVAETLRYSASLAWPWRVGPKRSAEQQLYAHSRPLLQEVIVQQTMRNMGIDHVAETKVGNDLIRGVSGGQKKRVTIAEVSLRRAVLSFYDGYTRGLDSATAYGLAQTLATVCWVSQGGRTVIASQYQASQEIFEVFDKVLVLQKEDDPDAPSQMVYFGPTDKATLSEFFDSVGCPKPEGHTWPDFLGTMKGGRHVSQTGPRPPGAPASAAELAGRFREHRIGRDLRRAIALQEHWEMNPKIVEEVHRQHAAAGVEAKATDFFENRERSPEFEAAQDKRIIAPFGAQLQLALAREWALLKARWVESRTTFTRTTIMGLIIGFLFFQLPSEFSRAFDRTGVVQMVTLLAATSVFGQVPTLLGDRSVMYKHTRNNMHRGSAFFLAKTIAQIPVQFVASLLTSAIIPTLAGFQLDGDRWIYFLLCHFILSLASVNVVKGFIFMGEAVFDGYLAGFFSLVTQMLLNGFMLPTDKLGWWFRWVVYVNPLQWAFSGFIMNEFDGLELAGFPGGPNGTTVTVSGESFRKNQLLIDYGSGFKWTILAIEAALTVAGVAFGCWVCENVRHDKTAHKVQFYVPCDKRMQFHAMVRGRLARLRGSVASAAAVKSESSDSTAVDVGAPAADKAKSAYFTFANVSYTVDLPVLPGGPNGRRKKRLKLINNASGYFRPGDMIALMGTSGAGKTTLLDVLARRKTGGHIVGDIRVNGVPQDDNFARICGYVEQTDMHMARATVSEAFMFAARLRRPSGETDAELRSVVDDVLRLLELDRLGDAMIGSPSLGVGISAEALKRVTIGVELVADPAILLMDEPTSGLDVAGAMLVAKVARNIARAGKAVVCTIHQPSRMVLETFDKLLLLKSGGNTVYFGPIGPGSADLVGFFERGGAAPFRQDSNPADYVLEVVSPSAGEPICDWSADRWAPSEERAALLDDLKDNAAAVVPADAEPITFEHAVASSPVTQLRALLHRQLVTTWRDPGTTIGLMYAALYPAFLLGLMFIGLTGNNDENGANYTSTALYAASFITPAFFIFLCLPGVYNDRAAFYREADSRYYSKSLYALAVQLSSMPYLIAASTLNSTVCYNLIPFREGGYFYFWLMFTSFLQLGWWQGLAVGGATGSMAVGTAVVIVPLNLSTMFCGFLVSRDDIGWWFRWLYYFNPCGITYMLQGLYKNEFEPRYPITKTPGIRKGTDLLAQRGWNDNEGEHIDKWQCLGLLWVFAAFWFAVGQWAFVYKRHGTQ